MISNTAENDNKEDDKKKRLIYLKERYQKLILNPRNELVSEIDKDLKEETSYSSV